MLSDAGVLKDDLLDSLHGVEEMLDEWTVPEAESHDQDWEFSLDAAILNLEHFVFWAAFIVRKLIDSRKLSDEFEALSFSVIEHPRIASECPQDYLNWHHVERFYDLKSGRKTSVNAKTICHQLVHSFIFMPVLTDDERGVDSLLVNSDFTRDRLIYEISWDEFRRFVGEAGEDSIAWMTYERPSGKLTKTRKPPGHG